MNETKKEKFKRFIKPYLTWKMLISLLIAWAIFIGWAIAFVVIGIISENAWFYGIGSAFIAWVIIPNGTFLIPFAMTPFIHKLIFGNKKGGAVK